MSLLVQAGVLIVAMVWAISRIRTTGEVLTHSVQNLDRTVQKLDKKLDQHSERITRLEAKFGE